MNWFESQMAASSFAKGHGGMSLGQQWALAALLREETKSKSEPSPKPSEKRNSGSLSKETLNFCRIVSLSLAALAAVLWLAVWIVR